MLNRFTGYKRLLALAALSGGAAPVERTATGNPLTFETDLSKPLKSLIAKFLPVQAAGTPSPDNILPITGWTGVNVSHGGKNLLDTSVKAVYSVTTVGLGSVYGRYETKLKAGTYTFSVEFLNSEHCGAYLKEKNGAETITLWTAQTTTTEKKFTITEDGEYNIWVYRSQAGGGVNPDNIGDFQLEVGETATAYEPYISPSVYHVTWSSEGTVYGGYVDLVTGEVWATWWGIDATWAQGTNPFVGSSFTRKTFNFSKPVKGTDENFTNQKCNIAPYSWNTNQSDHFYISESKAYLWLPNDSDGGTIVQFASKLISPVLITTLTPQQINALIGNNTVWSDANGDCEVTYLVSAAYAEDHPVGGLGSGLLGGGFGSGTGDPDEPGEPDQPDEPAEPDQPEEP